MSRFEDLLTTQTPYMRTAYAVRSTSNKLCRSGFQDWKQSLQETDPAIDSAYKFEDGPDEEEIWSFLRMHILYRDRELTIEKPFWWYEGISCYRHGWYDRDKAALYAQLQQEGSKVTLFVEHLGVILDVYESHCTEPGYVWDERRSLYKAAASFFGHAFHPLMEAFKLHLRGERESILYPCGAAIEASEVNRWVVEHLGIQRYNCLAGKGNGRGGRCKVTLADYTQDERLQVASHLMAQKRPLIPVQLLLCELALRKVIPQGIYDIQA